MQKYLRDLCCLPLLLSIIVFLPVQVSAAQYGSIAIGAPGDMVDGKDSAGAVNILPGSPNGLKSDGSQLNAQNDATLVIEADDKYGSALAWGDFNNDGYIDLAVGSPQEDILKNNEGAVEELHGSSTGLSFHFSWTQSNLLSRNDVDADVLFGEVLCTGDFNNDGFTDLAIGMPSEDISLAVNVIAVNAGAVNILYGSQTGLTSKADSYWYQGTVGIEGGAGAESNFGASLASGDFNNDGYIDLAIGETGTNIGGGGSGAVHILYGTENRLGENAGDIQRWHQDSANIPGTAEGGDFFGSSLTSGDFNNDGFADLAIGVPSEDIGAILNAGAINIMYGSALGLTGTGSQMWYQSYSGMPGSPETNDAFGNALASGDFNQDGFADLAIGVSGEDFNGVDNAGVVHILYGSNSKLTSNNNLLLHQESSGMGGTAVAHDRFGYALAAENFNGDDYADLIIGVPYKDIDNVSGAGMVYALFGTSDGLSTTGNQTWSQNSQGIDGIPETGDHFGISLAATPFPIYAPTSWPIYMSAILAGNEPSPSPPPAPATFSITSASFVNNQNIDIKYTLYGANISPQLSWQNAPAGTDHFMLTVLDIDAANWAHWKVQLPVATSSLAENGGADGGANLPAGSIRYNNTFFGSGIAEAAGTDYDGPKPPAGTGVHRYIYSIEARNGGGAVLAITEILARYEAP